VLTSYRTLGSAVGYPGVRAALTLELVAAIATWTRTPLAAARRYEGLVDWPLFSAPLGLPPDGSQPIADRIVLTFATGSTA
jgi:hypothetical protein